MRLTTFCACTMMLTAPAFTCAAGAWRAAASDYAGSSPADAAAPVAVGAAKRHLPRRGETMADVRARNGRPRSIRGPIGQPPMTRWNYPSYHVYFEGNQVIHTVVPSHPEPLYHLRELEGKR